MTKAYNIPAEFYCGNISVLKSSALPRVFSLRYSDSNAESFIVLGIVILVGVSLNDLRGELASDVFYRFLLKRCII